MLERTQEPDQTSEHGGQQPAEPGDDTTKLVPRQCSMRTGEASVIWEVDDACVAMLGYSREELIGKASLQLVFEEDQEAAIVSWMQMIDRPGLSSRTRLRYVRANGEIFWAEITYHNNLVETGFIDRDILDVDEQVDAQNAAGDKDRVIRGLADVLPSGVAQLDSKLRVVFTNDNWREITGLEDPSDHTAYARLVVEPEAEELRTTAMSSLASSGRYDGEVTLDPQDGTALRRCRLAVRVLEDDEGRTAGYVACLDDITESWRLQQRLFEQATRDQLTGLINRTAALEYLEGALDRANDTDDCTAVIFLDLNGFKRVNDAMGHAAGDQLLAEVAKRISRATRDVDVVARQGGDEFLIICERVGGRAEALRVARRVLRSMTGEYQIGGKLIESGGSCGVSIGIGSDHTAERLIAEADMAMYEQKRTGSHEPGFYKSSMYEEMREELNRDGALARAAYDGSLELHYQPIVELATHNILGYEALLRWRFEGELVMPDQFIGLAERRGFITEIGAWVVDEVCRQAAASSSPHTTWSLNVSPLQLRGHALDDDLSASLERHGVAPERLRLELTENVAMANDEATFALLMRLQDIGVKLVIDDFGTGFASLDYLRDLPLDGLKLDRCFTTDIASDRTQTIVSTVVHLVDALGLDLVVEGIETPEQAELIASTGATLGQGYLFGRPAPLEPASLTEGAESDAP